MKIEQARWTQSGGWEPEPLGRLSASAQLVLVFASTAILQDPAHYRQLRQR